MRVGPQTGKMLIEGMSMEVICVPKLRSLSPEFATPSF